MGATSVKRLPYLEVISLWIVALGIEELPMILTLFQPWLQYLIVDNKKTP